MTKVDVWFIGFFCGMGVLAGTLLMIEVLHG